MKNYLKVVSSVMAAGVVMVAAAPAAHAATQGNCSGTAGPGTAVTSATDGTLFVRSSFTPQCSANTHVVTDQDTTALWGGAVSTKGNRIYSGSSNGGAVRETGNCTTCDAASASTGAGTAATFGTSS